MMTKSFIKLYRVIVDHPVLANDNNAFLVFTKLLLRVDWKTGSLITGRFKMAELTNLKPNTVYATLKRLEKAKMITQVSNNRYTELTVLNWKKYQTDNNGGNNQITTKQQPNNTINNKEEVISNKEKEVVNNNTNKVIDMFKLVNPHYQLFFRNKTQRSAVDRLLGLYTLDVIENAIKVSQVYLGQEYKPQITSPLELERSWAKLAATWSKRGDNQKGKVGMV